MSKPLNSFKNHDVKNYMISNWVIFFMFVFQASKDPAKVNEIMCELDKNKDCAVSFEEFLVLVTKLTVCGAGFFQDYCPTVVITCCHK